MNATDVRTELGSRFDAPTLVAGMPLILRGRLAWAHDFVSNPALGGTFQAQPGGSFTANGAPIPHDSAAAALKCRRLRRCAPPRRRCVRRSPPPQELRAAPAALRTA